VKWIVTKTAHSNNLLRSTSSLRYKQGRFGFRSDADENPDGVQYERLTVLLLSELQKLRTEYNAYVAGHP